MIYIYSNPFLLIKFVLFFRGHSYIIVDRANTLFENLFLHNQK